MTQRCDSLIAGGAPGGGQVADMFGGLSMETPSASHSQSGMNGLLGLGTTPQAPAMSPAAPASADLFGGLSVGGKHTCLLAVDACGLQTLGRGRMPAH